MNEMIYGNTGRRDEGININMDQALYQKLQSRTFVPKLKSILNDGLQDGDKNFVFIGEVADKTGNFTIYGYNAKLESDSRGGDYGHYIAVPVGSDPVSVDFGSIKFMTEDGFVEYVNQQTLNDDKRFSLAPEQYEIDENVKKRIINNLMETFMRVRKRKNVTFCFERTTVEDFSKKSAAIIIDLMKYLPYRMRRNISFISHVSSNQKLPDFINIAAYASSCEYKPHDCISVDGSSDYTGDGLFSAYVETVFAMSDDQRQQYFERIYKDIELPAIEKGVDVKSDLYLIEVETKKLWENGDADMAIKSIFESVEDIVKVYPVYRDIAKNTLLSNKDVMTSYINDIIASTTSCFELKPVYDNIKSLYVECGFDFENEVVPVAKMRCATFINSSYSDAAFISTTNGIADIGNEVIDTEAVINAFDRLTEKMTSFNDIYAFYLDIREKNYIDLYDLQVCLTSGIEKLILKVTSTYSESKGKVAAIKKLFDDYCSTYSSSSDFQLIKDVYDRYNNQYSTSASEEAVNKGREVLNNLGSVAFGTIYDYKESIKKLAQIEVSKDEQLKTSTAMSYRSVSDKVFEEFRTRTFDFADIENFFNEICDPVNELEKNGVYDKMLKSDWGDEKYVSDGLYRLTQIFCTLKKEIALSQNLSEVLFNYCSQSKLIKEDEYDIRAAFDKNATVVIEYWLHRNPKYATKANLKKAKKELDKNGMRIPVSAIHACEDYIEYKSSKKGSPVAKLIIIGVIIAVIAGAAVLLFSLLGGDEEPETPSATEQKQLFISQQAVSDVEQYLNKFSGDDFDSGILVVGKVKYTEGDKCTVTAVSLEGTESPSYSAKRHESPNAVKLFPLPGQDSDKVYAITLVKVKSPKPDDAEYLMVDVFDIPELKGYDFEKMDIGNVTISEDKKPFYINIIQYIGYKNNLLQLGTAESVAEDNENKDEENGAQSQQGQPETKTSEQPTSEQKTSEQPTNEQKTNEQQQGGPETGTPEPKNTPSGETTGGSNPESSEEGNVQG